MILYILGVICLIALFFICVMIYDCHRFVVRDYYIESDKVSDDVDILVLSDLHSKAFGKDNERLINKISELPHNFIVVAGDMYTAVKSDRGDVALKLFNKIAKDNVIYYSNGNHEEKTRLLPEEFNNNYEKYSDKIKELGIKHIVNDSILAKSNIKIYGLELPFKYFKKFKKVSPTKEEIAECIGQVEDNKLNILIAHNPQYFDAYADWGADITISGHLHGGLVRFPYIGGILSPNYTLFPKYSGGKYNIGDKVMVLSCGLGTHHIPLRVFNPGELSYIHIKRK